MPSALPLLLIAAASTVTDEVPSTSVVWGSIQASSNAEWDTNARRAVSGNVAQFISTAARPSVRVADALVRLLLDSQAILQLGRDHQFLVGYTLGAKRFFREETEDLLNHGLSLGSLHRLGERVELSSSIWMQASRIRSELRDYNLGIATAQLGIELTDIMRLDLGGGLSGFQFFQESRFDYWGPQVYLRYTLQPIDKLSLFVRLAYHHRRFPNPGTSRDNEAQAEIGGRHRFGSLLLRAGYLVRIQRSNRVLEDIDRHRVYAGATWALPFWRLTTNLLATLQVNDGLSLTENNFLAEDDENQNSLRLQVRRPITDELDVELNYGLFANQFSTADVSFSRHTISLGVRAHLEGTERF